MSEHCFITGTDTDVGKTLVTAAVLSRLLSAGVDAMPMKPVQTGCPRRADGTLGNLDLDTCFQLTDVEPAAAEDELIAPYRFEPACSPHLAAEHAGETIEFDRILEAAGELMHRHETVLIEGAGGVLVPINRRQTMLDLMVALNLPVILASRPGLGTINHTLLSIRELQRAGLQVRGVVFCETCPAERTMIERDNWRTIEEFAGVKVLGRVPHLPELAAGTLTPPRFAAAVTESLPLN